MVLALAKMYARGVSTGNVRMFVETLCGASVSASTVSAITKTLDAGSRRSANARSAANRFHILSFAMYALREPDGRRGLATTNSIVHDRMAVCHWTLVIHVFPNELRFLCLASALARVRNEQWMVRRYVTVQKMSNNRA